ncbi:2'-5' RNA ligase family protein [Pseudonocardia humida]|uniref:2'-5' RNA ligase family protein n=1 Tax=Pseudonocardia humida TaxID=2800819 RepID=A0ABT1A9W4_9PSEU|nr:2'-5' RNA ligase family protein [Pseudonocardia humida]MCO1659609.1 2'-5' RNA ligase family protein [Pseudonocardia humida]
MPTVELLLDDELDGRVRAVWELLAGAGLPSLAEHRHPTNRPHLTLAAADALPPDGWLATALSGIPMALRLDGALSFGGARGALVWAVVPSRALLDLQAAVSEVVRPRSPWLRPDLWTPHVTLMLRATPAQRAEAVRLLGDLPAAEGGLVAARSYDEATRTVRELAVRR